MLPIPVDENFFENKQLVPGRTQSFVDNLGGFVEFTCNYSGEGIGEPRGVAADKGTRLVDVGTQLENLGKTMF